MYGCSERDMKEEIRRGTEKKWKTLGVLFVAGIIGLHMQHHLEERQPGIHMSCAKSFLSHIKDVQR